MTASLESNIRTRAFARVLGPFIVLVPGIIIVRAPDIQLILHSFFQNDIIVWFAGAFLLFCGLLVIAFHQYWSSAAAVMISLFGWFLALRGLVHLVAPQLIAQGAEAALRFLPAVRIGFFILVLVGLWLTYVGWLVKTPEKTRNSQPLT